MSTNEPTSAPAAFKPKKSVALSGTPAGNTALCTVGHSGNDLHYRGYDIHDLAAHCEFEEVAYLLVYGKLPTAADLVGLQSAADEAARPAACVTPGAGIAAGDDTPDGRASHRSLGARLHGAGRQRPR